MVSDAFDEFADFSPDADPENDALERIVSDFERDLDELLASGLERPPHDVVAHRLFQPMLRFVEVWDRLPPELRETLDFAPGALGGAPPDQGGGDPFPNLLVQDTVRMTVLAQDPEVGDSSGAFVTQIPVPADRLQRGPRNHRFHVVIADAASSRAKEPVVLHVEVAAPATDGQGAAVVAFPWSYVDTWADATNADARALAHDARFVAQNVFAVANYTLALFEKHLGRRIPWASGWPHLYLVPDARFGANANYSPPSNAVLFGWVPGVGGEPSVHSCLSFDVVAHEVTHAILDGLRPRYVEPGLPDQLAFHEALADLVALLSVFGLEGVAQRLLGADEDGRVRFLTDERAAAKESGVPLAAASRDEQAEFLKSTALLGLAEQLGRARAKASGIVDADPGRMPLRRSVVMVANTDWRDDPAFVEPHRRAEVLVAAFTHALVGMWVDRLASLDAVDSGLNASRVAEEGTKAAEHLLGMVLRSLDYLPPVELEFADVIDSVITADARVSPNDDHRYRDRLVAAFAAFGIEAPPHQILDRDGQAAPQTDAAGAGAVQPLAAFDPDPDASTEIGIRYEHLNSAAMRTSPEEVYEFIWNNANVLGIDVRLSTKVDRVISSTRVGPDGLIVSEVLADYTQFIRTTAGKLPPGMTPPEGMDPDAVVEMWGGGVLVFDQFGRFRLHQRKLILDINRQDSRLAHLFDEDLHGRDGSYGTTDGVQSDERFALLHDDPEGEDW